MITQLFPHTYYNYSKSRQLEGTFPGDRGTGAWLTTSNRTYFGWGRLTNNDDANLAHYVANFEPLPQQFDITAKNRRIRHYQRIRSSVECRALLRLQPSMRELVARGISWDAGGGLEIKAAFEYTNEFLTARQGLVRRPAAGSPILGTHSVPLLEVNEAQRSIQFFNGHWGLDWGYDGTGAMPFDFFDRYMVEAWSIDMKKPTLPAGSSIIDWIWEKGDLLWGSVYGLEIYDSSADERIGWSFATVRDGLLEVDEFYVRPAYRRRGFGARLAVMLRGLAAEKDAPIKLWVPYPDAEQSNRPALAAIVEKLGLGIHRSGVRWAAYAATADEPKTIAFPFVRIPAKPAASLSHGEELRITPTLEGSVLKFDDPFGPATDAGDWGACS